MRFPYFVLLSACALMLALPLLAQSPNGVLNGLVVDPANRIIVDADVVAVNDVTGVQYTTKTNGEGIYVLPALPPGPYRLQISKIGFKTLIKPDITLNVQDALAINFTLPVGAFSETVTVEGGAPLVNTESAAVSTVVDRQFAENLPLNGRSFQTLIQLTPGVVLTQSNGFDSGQFSVNGQRTNSNYWMVDGVSANTGIGASNQATPGGGLGGALGSFSALGGTNSLVSVDAMQEFRIQTSTYAPEFGRTPGAQISIVTRSGSSRFHGTLFDYFRNDALDASDWFNGYSNRPPLPKARERQNDFGGTVSGPIFKDRTFFFFSYEGLRLRLPQTTLTTVPDLAARLTAVPAMQRYLNTFPLPNGPDDTAAGVAQFNASYSNPASLDAYSLRIDHKLSNDLSIFGRYNYSPSQLVQRGSGSSPLSTLDSNQITTQTATSGLSWAASHDMADDLRFNYSRTSATSYFYQDGFGGAIPLGSLSFPPAFTLQNSSLYFDILSLQGGTNVVGQQGHELQRQINVVNAFSFQKGSHSLKFGTDYRRLSPLYAPYAYEQLAYFGDVPSAESGHLLLSATYSNQNPTFLFRNVGTYAQDTWRIIDRLVLTYGVRWDIDFVPRSTHGPAIPAVTGADSTDLSGLALAPAGTPPYQTGYGNVAPRLGLAYQVSQRKDWQTVLRGGFGVFYDLASSAAGNNVGIAAYPFGSIAINLGGTFPLDPAVATPPPIATPTPNTPAGLLLAFDPHTRLPYTLQWNVALEQGLGNQETISASYIGAAGRRLAQTELVSQPNPTFQQVDLVTNSATSDYDALQLQFQRRLSHSLQALASYTWSHSIDTASAGSVFNNANNFIPGSGNANRGPSDFDIRNAFSAGLTYDIPTLRTNPLAKEIVRAWSIENVIQARSAPPVEIFDANFFQFGNGIAADIRPDLVSGQALYHYGSSYPGGKAINPSAFTDPPVDSNGNPTREGDVPRNFLRGFGAVQWDFALHREFPIHDSLKLQFRAEMFNVLNHPNFGQPSGQFGMGGFGLSSKMLGQYLSSGNLGGGAFNPLYQIGGPRSIQLALKLQF